jgi:hypothetical protein
MIDRIKDRDIFFVVFLIIGTLGQLNVHVDVFLPIGTIGLLFVALFKVLAGDFRPRSKQD